MRGVWLSVVVGGPLVCALSLAHPLAGLAAALMASIGGAALVASRAVRGEHPAPAAGHGPPVEHPAAEVSAGHPAAEHRAGQAAAEVSEGHPAAEHIAERVAAEHTAAETTATQTAAADQRAAEQEGLKDHVIASELGAEAARQALETARSSRAAFLATVSHELRTPLHAIIGFTELVSDGMAGPVNAAQQEYLGDARTAANHLMALISDMLDYAKADAGRLTFEKAVVDPAAIVDEVLSLMGGLASKKDLRLTGECQRDVRLVGDALRVKQVLLNLVANAVKFTPRKGRVEVTCVAEGTHCRLSVTDTGVGIAPEEQAMVFEPFFQGDSGTDRQHSGTGLGLALVKRWAEAMGGSVSLESARGAGSCFTVRWPLAKGAIAALRRAERLAVPDVLVAEDDDATRLMLTRLLESQGCEVRQAGNGQRALEAVMARLPDVVVLDLMMPEVDGYELLVRLRSLPGGDRVKVLVFSATNPQGAERERLLAHSAELYVKGARTPSELAARVTGLAHGLETPRSAA